ncbi:MAG: DinB family protein [Chloroflexota bacterium]
MTEPGVALGRRVEAALAAVAALGPAIAAAPPLSAERRLGHNEDAWGPREVLAHLAEAVAFWHGEIERVLAADRDGHVPAFGRVPGDAARVAIIARDHGLPAAVLLARLDREGAAATVRIARLTPAELARVGRHPVWGEMTVGMIVERTLASHFEGHVEQLRALLAD